MRLSHQEIAIIKSTISNVLIDSKIILFGSRVYDDKRGGDIDLLIQTNQNVDIQRQIKILAEMEVKGIERKVDLLFQTPFTKEQSIFKTALKEGIVL
ncbi:MAG: nucleotidyltransferase domain-containing protein [Sulfurimonas sp.]|jgi:predicted nucleotidyltransferase